MTTASHAAIDPIPNQVDPPEATSARNEIFPLATLDPACFSIVMATGIVALACWQLRGDLDGLAWVAKALSWTNGAIFLSLLLLSVLRIARYPRNVLADFSDHSRAFGLFSTIAASCVLASDLDHITAQSNLVVFLWWVGLVLWIAITYGVFAGITTAPRKPSLRDGLQGSWILAVVATQAVAVLTTSLSQRLPTDPQSALLLAQSLWLIGGMLYLVFISLIIYRYCFEPLDGVALTPPYWINMGAMAISTLAGTSLIFAADTSPLLQQFLPFLKGATLLFWATATWWIPLLAVLGFWRHRSRGVPLNYDLRYWSMVFPLGMYSVATFEMYRWLSIDVFHTIARVFALLALLAWIVTAIGLLKRCGVICAMVIDARAVKKVGNDTARK